MLKIKLLVAMLSLVAGEATACTIFSPAVNAGSIQAGQVSVLPVQLSLNCANGVAWSVTSPATNQLVVGANTTSNQMRLETLGGTTIEATGVAGTGTGIAQTVNLQVRLSNTSLAGIYGGGALSGSIPLTITY